MSVINRLPIGGGASYSGAAGLNIFTQMNEPEKKDGIWIQTNNQYEHILINQQYYNNENGVWSELPNINWVSDAVSYNNNIYQFANNYCYKYNNGWVQLTNSPCIVNKAVVHNGNIYIFSRDNTSKCYIFNGNIYTAIIDAPVTIGGPILSYGGSIHAFQCTNRYYYKYNGISWTQMFQIDYGADINAMTAVVFGGYMHVYKLFFANENYSKVHLIIDNVGNKWNGDTNNIPDDSHASTQMCVYNNEVHSLVYDYDGAKHYKSSDLINWQLVDTLPSKFVGVSKILVNNGDIHAFMTHNYGEYFHVQYQAPEKIYSSNTLIINRGNSNSGAYLTAINDNSEVIKGNNNRFVSGFDDCFYFADSAFDWNAPMYYGDGSRWIKFKN